MAASVLLLEVVHIHVGEPGLGLLEELGGDTEDSLYLEVAQARAVVQQVSQPCHGYISTYDELGKITTWYYCTI
jgi:hypothetical protein